MSEKRWIYSGEFRKPKDGEHWIDDGGQHRTKPYGSVIHGEHDFPYAIVTPLPDDAVIVPREKIEALRKKVEHGFWMRGLAVDSPYQEPPPKSSVVYAEELAILACAEPPKSKDAILDNMREAAGLILPGSAPWSILGRAIAAREAELKERGKCQP